jgi:hypothetical protein
VPGCSPETASSSLSLFVEQPGSYDLEENPTIHCDNMSQEKQQHTTKDSVSPYEDTSSSMSMHVATNAAATKWSKQENERKNRVHPPYEQGQRPFSQPWPKIGPIPFLEKDGLAENPRSLLTIESQERNTDSRAKYSLQSLAESALRAVQRPRAEHTSPISVSPGFHQNPERGFAGITLPPITSLNVPGPFTDHLGYYGQQDINTHGSHDQANTSLSTVHGAQGPRGAPVQRRDMSTPDNMLHRSSISTLAVTAGMRAPAMNTRNTQGHVHRHMSPQDGTDTGNNTPGLWDSPVQRERVPSYSTYPYPQRPWKTVTPSSHRQPYYSNTTMHKYPPHVVDMAAANHGGHKEIAKTSGRERSTSPRPLYSSTSYRDMQNSEHTIAYSGSCALSPTEPNASSSVSRQYSSYTPRNMNTGSDRSLKTCIQPVNAPPAAVSPLPTWNSFPVANRDHSTTEMTITDKGARTHVVPARFGSAVYDHRTLNNRSGGEELSLVGLRSQNSVVYVHAGVDAGELGGGGGEGRKMGAHGEYRCIDGGANKEADVDGLEADKVDEGNV